jgi:hypothetical protein
MIEVFSSGGGTQSSAIAALIVQGRLPKPDITAIVDTGRERGTTWTYIDDVVSPALKAVGVEIHRVKYTDWGTKPEHGNNWLSHNGNTVLLPGFTDQSGGVGKLSGFCSDKWKKNVRDKWLSHTFGITRSKFRVWIGFSLNETRRALGMMSGDEWKDGLIRFPLIHDVPLRRHQAINECLKLGWPEPPRSTCYMCPNQLDDEWNAATPEELRLAAELERQIQAVDPFFWLHKSCTPIDQVDFTKEPDLFERACNSGGCFT